MTSSRPTKPAKKTSRTRAESSVDPLFAPVADAFAGDPRVTRKRMFSSSNVLSVQGKIFAMLVRGKLVAKLPKERVDELVTSGRGEPFDPGHGRLMKEWVALSPGRGRTDWTKLAKEAYTFVKAKND